MQHIREQHHVEGARRKRQLEPVKRIHWNRAPLAGGNFHSPQFQIRTSHPKLGSQPSIARAHIKHAGPLREQPVEPFRQPADAPPVDEAAMKCGNGVHG
jgi:hypothetical protein